MNDFMNYLETIPWAFSAILLVALFVSFAIFGILFVRRTYRGDRLRTHHDVAGFVYTNLGVLYAVLLGFTVVNAQQRFDKIAGSIEVEASYIAALYRGTAVLPQESKHKIRIAIRNYTESILKDEWDSMSRQSRSKNTEIAFDDLWDCYDNLDDLTPKQQVWYTESVAKLNQLLQARFCRLLDANTSLGPEMWTFLILGGIVMVAFVWFFWLENRGAHLLMASLLAASIAFLLFLIYSLDTVFTGNVQVSPDAIERVLQMFE